MLLVRRFHYIVSQVINVKNIVFRKSYFCLLLFLSFLLVSCASNDVVEDDLIETEPNIVEEIKIEDPFEDIKEDYLDEYSDISASNLSKFLGTAIVKVRPVEYQELDIPIIDTSCSNSAIIFKLLHLNPDWFESYAISASLHNTRSYTVIIGKPSGLNHENVVDAIQKRKRDLETLKNKYPDQYYNVEHSYFGSLTGDYSDFLVFIISDNSEQIFDEIDKAIQNLNISEIRPVEIMTEDVRETLENSLLDEEKSKIETELNF